jgi:hypothetical protein
MAIAIEVLRQYSNRRNGIVKYKRNTDISPAEWRASINAPTALALAAMMLWEICSQDVLRLEPYFCFVLLPVSSSSTTASMLGFSGLFVLRGTGIMLCFVCQ